jgi:hypothetical protein
VLAAAVALGFVAVAALLGAVAWRGSQRRLPPGGPLGLPLRSLRRDEHAWRTGHEAAAGPIGVAAGVAAVGALAVATSGTDTVGATAALLAAAGTVAGVAVGVRAAVRAARSAG